MGQTGDGRGKEILESIDRLEKNTDYERLGLERAAAGDGVFTEKGYLSTVADFRETFHGPDNVPREHRLSGHAALTKDRAEAPAKTFVMEQIAAARTERAAAPRKDAPDRPKSRGPEL